jgi:hypothetical protein
MINETGKGDHRHYGEREEAYDFQTIERLVEDFHYDFVRLAAWEW